MKRKKKRLECLNTKFLKDSSILLDGQYDNYLKLWFGDHKWRLIYRASEHGYSAHSFHDYCDNKGPTIMIKKSTGSWIFGGYTTQSWGGFCILFSGWLLIIDDKDDSQAFIFTLKNLMEWNPLNIWREEKVMMLFDVILIMVPYLVIIIGVMISSLMIIVTERIVVKLIMMVSMHMQVILDIWVHFVNTNSPKYSNRFTVFDYEVFAYY